MKKFILALVIMVVAVGCMSQPVTIADSNIPLTPGKYTEIGPAQGRAFGIMIFGLALSEPYPAKSAVERALAGAEADALTGITGDATIIQLGPISFVTTTVNATAVKVND